MNIQELDKKYLKDSKHYEVMYECVQDAINELGEDTTELVIASNPNYAVFYTLLRGKGKWKPGEEAISKSGEHSLHYAIITNTRFVIGEAAISSNPYQSCKYAKRVIKGRFRLGEDTIKNNLTYYKKYLDMLSVENPTDYATLMLETKVIELSMELKECKDEIKSLKMELKSEEA